MNQYRQRPQVQRPRAQQQAPHGYGRPPSYHQRQHPEPKGNGKLYAVIVVLALLVIVLAVVLFMTNCSGAETGAEQQGQGDVPAPATQVDFDGTAYSDAGEGAMYLRTAGGTSEGGNVPELAGGSAMTQIEVNTDGMDGSVCTVYVDGMENTTMNAGERTQQSITLQGDALIAGTHTVELVKMEGDALSIYKMSEYKVV